MPLAPQLITEMSPGGDPDDLSEFIGPELATLVSTTQDKSIPIIQNPDMNTLYSDISGHVNYESSDNEDVVVKEEERADVEALILLVE